MVRRSRLSQQKRQRERRKAEKAARKRAKRHGQPVDGEPRSKPISLTEPTDDGEASGSEEKTEPE